MAAQIDRTVTGVCSSTKCCSPKRWSISATWRPLGLSNVQVIGCHARDTLFERDNLLAPARDPDACCCLAQNRTLQRLA
jgi:hypothetical protein